MNHLKLIGSLLAASTAVVALQLPASAQMRTSRSTYQTAPANTGNTLGFGLKAGNGLGYTGLDFIVNPSPNLSLDIQAGLTPSGVLGVAPSVQYHMDPAGGPYAGVGFSYTPGGNGVFGNVGWQLKLVPNVGLLLGVGYLYPLNATAGGLNYEVGLRYFFM